jgi:hypothetical protein
MARRQRVDALELNLEAHGASMRACRRASHSVGFLPFSPPASPWWRMLAKTDSTVAMRRLYSARPCGESIAVRRHANVACDRGQRQTVRCPVKPVTPAGGCCEQFNTPARA